MDLKQLEALFLGLVKDHPEIVAGAETAAQDAAQVMAAPPPERFYDVIRDLVAFIPSITPERRAEYLSAVAQHEQEHAALTAQLPAAGTAAQA